jgi:hypothetical protein
VERDDRRRLLEASLTGDSELIEPRGTFAGRDAIRERIEGFAARFPGARVDVTTAVDEHNGVARYGWRIRDAGGAVLLDGIDVVDQVRVTVVHEVAHHFGIDDERLRELGWG